MFRLAGNIAIAGHVTISLEKSLMLLVFFKDKMKYITIVSNIASNHLVKRFECWYVGIRVLVYKDHFKYHNKDSDEQDDHHANNQGNVILKLHIAWHYFTSGLFL